MCIVLFCLFAGCIASETSEQWFLIRSREVRICYFQGLIIPPPPKHAYFPYLMKFLLIKILKKTSALNFHMKIYPCWAKIRKWMFCLSWTAPYRVYLMILKTGLVFWNLCWGFVKWTTCKMTFVKWSWNLVWCSEICVKVLLNEQQWTACKMTFV